MTVALSAVQLLEQARSAGLTLSAEGGQLKLKGDKGAIAAFSEPLKAAKASILELLQAPEIDFKSFLEYQRPHAAAVVRLFCEGLKRLTENALPVAVVAGREIDAEQVAKDFLAIKPKGREWCDRVAAFQAAVEKADAWRVRGFAGEWPAVGEPASAEERERDRRESEWRRRDAAGGRRTEGADAEPASA